MSTYRQIRNQIAELEKKADAARRIEAARVIAKIRAQVAKFDLKPDDIFGEGTVVASVAASSVAKAKPAKKVMPPKYQDPKTGKTWNGRGKPPGWIVEATKLGKRDAFLITRPGAVSAAEVKEKKEKDAKANASLNKGSTPKKTVAAKTGAAASASSPPGKAPLRKKVSVPTKKLAAKRKVVRSKPTIAATPVTDSAEAMSTAGVPAQST